MFPQLLPFLGAVSLAFYTAPAFWNNFSQLPPTAGDGICG